MMRSARRRELTGHLPRLPAAWFGHRVRSVLRDVTPGGREAFPCRTSATREKENWQVGRRQGRSTRPREAMRMIGYTGPIGPEPRAGQHRGRRNRCGLPRAMSRTGGVVSVEVKYSVETAQAHCAGRGR